MSLESKIQEVLESKFENVKASGEENLKATCPFHEGSSTDKTFSISLRTGAWICFHSSCGEHGSFPQLLKKLGMTAQQIDRAFENIKPKAEVPDYLRVRAELASEPIYLPEYILGAWSEVPKQLLDAGFSEKILKDHEVGVDKHRKRIIFPIRDYMGRLVAINGRAMEPWVSPRYKVYDARWSSGELRDVVDKKYVPDNRRHLYGYHNIYAERFFKEESQCPPLIIVEGYKACLWMRQNGFEHTVALQGSSISIGQKRLLHRLAGPFYILLDHQPGKAYADNFGRHAALDIANSLNRTGKSFVCLYPKEKPLNTQPDSLKKTELEDILKKAKTTTQLILEQNT